MAQRFKKKWKWYVYIIECNNGLYYTGMTKNVSIRADQHVSGFGSSFTRKHGAKKLRYTEEFDDFWEARKAEKILKDYSRKKKEKMFNCSVDLKFERK